MSESISAQMLSYLNQLSPDAYLKSGKNKVFNKERNFSFGGQLFHYNTSPPSTKDQTAAAKALAEASGATGPSVRRLKKATDSQISTMASHLQNIVDAEASSSYDPNDAAGVTGTDLQHIQGIDDVSHAPADDSHLLSMGDEPQSANRNTNASTSVTRNDPQAAAFQEAEVDKMMENTRETAAQGLEQHGSDSSNTKRTSGNLGSGQGDFVSDEVVDFMKGLNKQSKTDQPTPDK